MNIPQTKSFYGALLAGTIAMAFTGMTDAALARYLDPSQVDLVSIHWRRRRRRSRPKARRTSKRCWRRSGREPMPTSSGPRPTTNSPYFATPMKKCMGRRIFAAEPAVHDDILQGRGGGWRPGGESHQGTFQQAASGGGGPAGRARGQSRRRILPVGHCRLCL